MQISKKRKRTEEVQPETRRRVVRRKSGRMRKDNNVEEDEDDKKASETENEEPKKMDPESTTIISSTSGADILQLPVEMQQYIFSWLPLQTAAKLNLVCKHWREIMSDDVWWQSAFSRHFGIPSFLRYTIPNQFPTKATN